MLLNLLHPLKSLRNDGIMLAVDLRRVNKAVKLGIASSFVELVALASSIPLMETIAGVEDASGKKLFSQLGLVSSREMLIGSLILFLTGQALRFTVTIYKVRFTTSLSKTLTEIIGSTLYVSYLFIQNKKMAVENSSANAQNVINAGVYVNYRVLSMTNLLSEASTLLMLVLSMSIYSPSFILPIVLLSGVTSFAVYKLTITSVKKIGADVVGQTKIRNRILNESLRNIDEIQIYSNQKYFIDMFNDTNSGLQNAERKYNYLTSLTPLLIEISAISVFALLFGVQVMGGESSSTLLATTGVLLVGTMRIIPSLGRVLNEFQKMGYGLEARFAIKRDLLLDGEPNKERLLVERFEAGCQGKEPLSIHLCNLEFRYPDRVEKTLFRLNREISGYQLFGIKGKSGSGKSTLLRLILGNLNPSIGSVELNGRNIHDDLTSWRGRIGFVSQSIFFIDGSIRENIIFGGEARTDEDMRDSLQKVGLGEFIEMLPEGLDTSVGESGELFSGGQRQRIGIARALNRRPSILILDEPSSALDGKSTLDLIRTLRLLSRTTLVIVASHDEVLLNECDQIIDLDVA